MICIEGWSRQGLTDKQIAKNVGISYSTFNLYKSNKEKYSEFSEAIKKGKEVVDFEVENTLLKLCLGYTEKEEYIVKDEEGNEIKKVINKYYPPNATLIIFYLKNRMPEFYNQELKQKKVEFKHKKKIENEELELKKDGR